MAEAIDYNGKDMWFAEWATGCYASINAAGSIAEHATGLSQTRSTGMAAGQQGSSWFVTDINGIYEIGAKASLKQVSTRPG